MNNIDTQTADEPATHKYPESKSATAIERQTAQLPSDMFLYAAGGAVAASLTLKLMGREKDAMFCRPVGSNSLAARPV